MILNAYIDIFATHLELHLVGILRCKSDTDRSSVLRLLLLSVMSSGSRLLSTVVAGISAAFGASGASGASGAGASGGDHDGCCGFRLGNCGE